MDENLKRRKTQIDCFFIFHISSRVAFCIIFYLTCTTPSLWIIHVETANRKLYRLAENKLNARTVTPSKQHYLANNSHDSTRLYHVLPTTTPLILSIGHIECHDKVNSTKKRFRKILLFVFRLGTIWKNNDGLMQFKKHY
jgi:hypothetical protein